jgi:signal peptide peptidase SppA
VARPLQVSGDGIATIQVQGLLAKDASWYPDTAYDDLVSLFEQADGNPKVRGVFLDIDSPGGSAVGNPEVSTRLAELAARKPVLAYTDQLMASAAYAIAAGATAIYASPSSLTGSIGTYTMFADWSGFLEQCGIKIEAFHNREGDLKTTWLPYTSLTEAQRQHIQEGADRAFAMFGEHVTHHRTLAEGTMRGQAFLGAEALARGVIDRVALRAEALADLAALAG